MHTDAHRLAKTLVLGQQSRGADPAPVLVPTGADDEQLSAPHWIFICKARLGSSYKQGFHGSHCAGSSTDPKVCGHLSI